MAGPECMLRLNSWTRSGVGKMERTCWRLTSTARSPTPCGGFCLLPSPPRCWSRFASTMTTGDVAGASPFCPHHAHGAAADVPSDGAAVWLSFVEELRGRCDRNESLPNMGYVPRLEELDATGMRCDVVHTLCREVSLT